MLIRQANQKTAIFVTIDIFSIKTLNLKQIFATDVMIY